MARIQIRSNTGTIYNYYFEVLEELMYVTPEKSFEIANAPGVNHDILFPSGHFRNIRKTFPCRLPANNNKENSLRNLLNNMFGSSAGVIDEDGYADLIFVKDNETPVLKYKAALLEALTMPDYGYSRGSRVDLTFSCQPHQQLITPVPKAEDISTGYNLNNTLLGAGINSVYAAGCYIIFEFMLINNNYSADIILSSPRFPEQVILSAPSNMLPKNTTITVDTRLGIAYYGSGNNLTNVTGLFTGWENFLDLVQGILYFRSNMTSVSVTADWRWLAL